MSTGRTVVVLPGRNYGPYVPQVFFPMFAALRRGADPQIVNWRDLELLDGLDLSAIPAWVAGQIEPGLRGLDPRSTVVIGKSLGSHAAELVAALGLPAIWVTPVLTSPAIVDALRRTSAPSLLAGGTGDPVWDSEVARACSDHVLELPDADHGLFVPGPLDRSAANIGRLATACEHFLDTVVWPASDQTR